MKRCLHKKTCLALAIVAGLAVGGIAVFRASCCSSPVALPQARDDGGLAGGDVPHAGRVTSSEPMIASYLYGFQRPASAPGTGSTTEDQNANPNHPVGLLLNNPRACQGYTLLAPLLSTTTYLIDMQGRVVHRWASDCTPALSTYLLENGHLLRTGTLGRRAARFGPGFGGRVQELTWTGELVWDFRLGSSTYRPHHDAVKLPNGNVLMIVLEKKSAEEARAAGRNPELIQEGPWQPDAVLEIQPTGKNTGKVVWEWHVADHLIQDSDPSRPNYGAVAAHPERIDVNYDEGPETTLVAQTPQTQALRSLGYVGSGSRRRDPEWTHINSIAYNAGLDQVLLSVRAFSEVWIIDHGTTTREAAGHTGGRRGKGGDLLYRWGNEAAHRAGSQSARSLFAQHSATWIASGLPGQGHLLIFNNGMGRPDGRYSSVEEVALPFNGAGNYEQSVRRTDGPARPIWSYTSANRRDFYSSLLSGAQRLANGDTLICQGVNGTVFEVTADKKIVWKYVCPAVRTASHRAASGRGTQSACPLFRACRYPASYAGLADKKLVPGKTIEEFER